MGVGGCGCVGVGGYGWVWWVWVGVGGSVHTCVLAGVQETQSEMEIYQVMQKTGISGGTLL